MNAQLAISELPLLVLHQGSSFSLTDDQFFDFCQANRDLRIERTSAGDIIIMSPAGWKTGTRNARVVGQLIWWADRDGRGEATDSNAGYRLPNGAVRAPDAAWVLKSRLSTLTSEQRDKFLPLAPDFAIELKSPTDSISTLEDKMREYIETGTRLGWLIDPETCCVSVYRPGRPVEILESPQMISGDPELPGFTLNLEVIW